LLSPAEHEDFLVAVSSSALKQLPIIVDFSKGAVNRNAELYCKYRIPFVMGATGGDGTALERIVVESGNVAVVAPNMALPIVAFQEFMDNFSRRYEGQMNGYTLKVRESHQKTKPDASGTAKAFLRYFQRLGIELDTALVDKLKMENPVDIMLPLEGDSTFTVIRDPRTQRGSLGVPEEFLSGHGWHTYNLSLPDSPKVSTLPLASLRSELREFLERKVFAGYDSVSGPPFWKRVSSDGNVVVGLHDIGTFEAALFHNINGRQVYADGGISLVGFLSRHRGEKGRVYTAIDVLNNLGKNN